MYRFYEDKYSFKLMNRQIYILQPYVGDISSVTNK